MANETRIIEERFEVVDHATGHLDAIHKAGERVSGMFNHASEVMGSFATVGGIVGAAFGAHEMIKGTMTYLDTVRNIQKATGMTAEKTDGLMSAFAGVGIEAATSEHMINAMSKRGAQLEMSMGGANAAVHGMGLSFSQMGIDVRKGPEQALMRMSKLAQQGKINAGQISALYRGLPMDKAQKMMDLLKQGPKGMAEAMNEWKKRGASVTQEQVDTGHRIQLIVAGIKEKWERLQLVIGTRLLPVIEKLLAAVNDKMSGWIDAAVHFGKTMGSFLSAHLHTVLQISKVLALNFTMMKMTGGGMTDWAKKGAGIFGKLALPGGMKSLITLAPAAAGGRTAYSVASQMAGKLGGGDGMTGAFKQLVEFGRSAARLGPVVMSVGRLVLIGSSLLIIVTVIAATIYAFKKNLWGVRDIAMNFFEKVKAHVAVIKNLFAPVLSMFSEGGVVGNFFSVLIPTIVQTLADVADGILQVIETIIITIGYMKNHLAEALLNPVETLKDSWRQANAMVAAEQKKQLTERLAAEHAAATRPVTPKDRDQAPQTNFYNSKFDITQSFAEGFDPDRIAVAFTNELAAQGERKLMSSYLPVGAVR